MTGPTTTIPGPAAVAHTAAIETMPTTRWTDCAPIRTPTTTTTPSRPTLTTTTPTTGPPTAMATATAALPTPRPTATTAAQKTWPTTTTTAPTTWPTPTTTTRTPAATATTARPPTALAPAPTTTTRKTTTPTKTTSRHPPAPTTTSPTLRTTVRSRRKEPKPDPNALSKWELKAMKKGTLVWDTPGGQPLDSTTPLPFW